MSRGKNEYVTPVTSATAERSFSVLRRLKTYVRSTMKPHQTHPPFPGLVACTAKKASYAPEKSRDQTLRPLVVPRFDCHPLASRPILMDNNARPHRARRVQDYLQQEATLLAKLRCQNVVTT